MKNSGLRDVHWSRDYVEHLRTSHFALILASAALIALVLTAKPYDAGKALTELQQILQLKARWGTDWVSATINKQLGRVIFRPGSVRLGDDFHANKGSSSGNEQCANTNGVSSVPFSETVFAKFPSSSDEHEDATVLEVHLKGAWSPTPDWQEHNEFYGPFPANNLGEMNKWWDSLGKSRFAALAEGVVKNCLIFDFSSGDKTVSCSVLTHAVNREPYATRNWAALGRIDAKLDAYVYFPGRKLSTDCNYYDEHDGGYWFTGWYPDHLVRIYATYSLVQIDQSLVAGALGVSPGSFDSSFRDLSNASRGLEGLSLEKLEARFAEEVAKGADNLEAFGMKIPAELVTNWGTVMLMCGQLYLIVYLRQLSGRLKEDDDGWNVPWIALEGSWVGQGMYIASLVLAPAAVIFLRYHALLPPTRSHPGNVGMAIFVLFILLSVVQSLACWHYRPLRKTRVSNRQDAKRCE